MGIRGEDFQEGRDHCVLSPGDDIRPGSEDVCDPALRQWDPGWLPGRPRDFNGTSSRGF